MPAIRTQTFTFDPGEHMATDGGYRLLSTNAMAVDADGLAEKHDTPRRVVVSIFTYGQHDLNTDRVLAIDPESPGVAI